MAEERQLSGQGLYGARHRAARPAGSAALPAPAAAATVMRDVPGYGIADAAQSPGPHPQLRRDGGKGSAPAKDGASWRETREPAELQRGSYKGGRWSNFARSCGWLHLPRHGEPSCLRRQKRQGASGLRSELDNGEPPGPAVSLLQLMEPILIQDAEDIIDLNKLSVKEKL